MFRLGWRRNPALLAVLGGTLVLQLALIYLPVAHEILSTEPLSVGDLAVVLVVSTALFWVVEMQKLLRRRRPDPGGRLMTDARPPDVADHPQPDKGVAR